MAKSIFAGNNPMRAILASVVICIGSLLADTAHAQTNLMFGPSFGIGPSYFLGSVPEGMQSTPGLGYTVSLMAVGVVSDLPLSLGLTYDSRELNIESKDSASRFASNYTMIYFGLQPAFQFSFFRAGLDILLPMGGSVINTIAGEKTNDNVSNANVLLGLNLGLTSQITDTGDGPLMGNINLSFPLTSTLSGGPGSGGRTIALEAGITYFFTMRSIGL